MRHSFALTLPSIVIGRESETRADNALERKEGFQRFVKMDILFHEYILRNLGVSNPQRDLRLKIQCHHRVLVSPESFCKAHHFRKVLKDKPGLRTTYHLRPSPSFDVLSEIYAIAEEEAVSARENNSSLICVESKTKHCVDMQD